MLREKEKHEGRRERRRIEQIRRLKGGWESKVVRKGEVWRAAAVLSDSFHLPNLPFVCV